MAIKTTGELRAFVAEAMEEMKVGDLDIEKAQLVVKLSGRITESLYAEVKQQKLLIEVGKEPDHLGSQLIGEKAHIAAKRKKDA